MVWPPRGTRGFGYDPIFVPDGESETFGEIDPARSMRCRIAPEAFEKLIRVQSLATMTERRARHSGSMCIGRSARQMPVLRFQLAMSAMAASTRRGSSPPISRSSTISRRSRRGARVSSIFFGGGTPSLMRPARRRGDPRCHRQALARRAATPRSRSKRTRPASRPRTSRLPRAGVNRLSLGVQALDDQSLKALGRRHRPNEALAALALAKRHFARVSFDLIYAREGQTARAGQRAQRGARPRGRSSLALSAHHRGRHAVRRAACRPAHCEVPTASWRARSIY